MGNAGVSGANYRIDQRYETKLNKIGESLLRGIKDHDKDGYAFEFHAIKETYVNAFAYPGGKIFITDQMIEDLNLSDDEIAAVVAHEIGHVMKRHSVKGLIEKGIVMIAFSACFYEDQNDDDGKKDTYGEKIGKILIQNAVLIGGLSFSRLHEFEADSTGWEAMVMSKSGYDPVAMITLFEKLMKLTSDDGSTHWHSTHPGTKDRIEALIKTYCSNDSTKCKRDLSSLDSNKLKQPIYRPQNSQLEL